MDSQDSAPFPGSFLLFAAVLAAGGLFAASVAPVPALAAKHVPQHPAHVAPSGHLLSLDLSSLVPKLPATLSMPAAVLEWSPSSSQGSADANSTSSPAPSPSASPTPTPIQASSTSAHPSSGTPTSSPSSLGSGSSLAASSRTVATSTASHAAAIATSSVAAAAIPHQGGPKIPAGDVYKADRLSPQTTFFVDLLAAFFAFLGLLLIQGFPDIEVRRRATPMPAR